ncbi:hypothetical protein ATI02_4879 [Pseudomonas baetica]|uniref:Uncharacterized protein n=1 Tax=Pseudomonas baetica TaxID=674054 RepID=A0ABX4Q501_9PSED|nr:hypothetical protein [Pseudomonas baetica]PKA71871.1 hypothetical protein ATI02_4879 [Pseudomonas baetica]PTC20335.1 hypothetical protein C0J26_10280 [Pseudomonas baetica]
MSNSPFTGECNVRSTYNDEPYGEDLFTTDVSFTKEYFQATKSSKFLQVLHSPSLDENVHELEVGPDKETQIKYRTNHGGIDRIYDVVGTVELTIGTNARSGEFKGKYYDNWGRELIIQGDFDAKLT